MVERLLDVVVVGSSDAMEGGCNRWWWVRRKSCLFVHDVHVHFWQMLLTWLSKRQKGHLVIILANLTNLTKQRPLCLYI